MLIKLDHVRDYTAEGLGKRFHFLVDRNRRITVDTDNDNSVTDIWFHDSRSDGLSWFAVDGLLYIENIMTGIYLDPDKASAYDDIFVEYATMEALA